MSEIMVPVSVMLGIVVLAALGFNLGAFIHIVCMMRKKFIHIVLASLFVSNFFLALLGYTFTVVSMAYGNTKIMDSATFCIFTAYVVFALSVTSINHIVALSVHRYIQFYKPLFGKWINRKKSTALLIVLLLWFLGFLFCMPPLLGMGRYIALYKLHTCSLDFNDQSKLGRLYMTLSFLISYFLPVGIVTYLSWKIVTMTRPVGQSTQRRYINMEILMATAFFIIWGPYAVIALMTMFNITVPIEAELVSAVFAKTSAVTNSLLYILAYNLWPTVDIFCCSNFVEDINMMQSHENEGNNGQDNSNAHEMVCIKCQSDLRNQTEEQAVTLHRRELSTKTYEMFSAKSNN